MLNVTNRFHPLQQTAQRFSTLNPSVIKFPQKEGTPPVVQLQPLLNLLFHIIKFVSMIQISYCTLTYSFCATAMMNHQMYYLILYTGIFTEKLIVAYADKKFPGSLSGSQQPLTGPCPQMFKSSFKHS